MIPFSLIWCGFAIFWQVEAYTSDAPLMFLLVGGFFVVIGLHITVGRFVMDILERRRTYYGLSGERALIVSNFLNPKVTSVALETVTDLSFDTKPDQSGSIWFGAKAPDFGMQYGQYGTSMPGFGKSGPPAFEMIEDVKSVYDAVQRARRDLE
ncbi:MAG: hypothetical protein AAGF86_13925 [Pseudomonadota bacterium]